jgi:hypothetical protein
MIAGLTAWLDANYGQGQFPPNATQRAFHHLHTTPQLFQLYQAEVAPNGVLDRRRRPRLHRRIGPMNHGAILIKTCARLCP